MYSVNQNDWEKIHIFTVPSGNMAWDNGDILHIKHGK